MQIDQKLAQEICNIARHAGHRIFEIYKTDFTVVNKDDLSPLTTADTTAHNIICQSLACISPDTPILSEESPAIPYTERQQWQYYWLVDPLDGTREFIKRNDQFTVNISLIEGNKAKLGVIYVPVTGICYYAAHTLGAFKVDARGITRAIHTKRSSKDRITIAGSRSHPSRKLKLLTSQLDNIEIITLGSSLKFCLVAEGKIDIYPKFGETSEWDTAAAQCIVEEAGGCIVDMAFKPLCYNTKKSLLNPQFIAIGDQTFGWMAYFDKIR